MTLPADRPTRQEGTMRTAPFCARLSYHPREPPKPYQLGVTTTDVTVWTRPVRVGGPGGPAHADLPARATGPFPRRRR